MVVTLGNPDESGDDYSMDGSDQGSYNDNDESGSDDEDKGTTKKRWWEEKAEEVEKEAASKKKRKIVEVDEPQTLEEQEALALKLLGM